MTTATPARLPYDDASTVPEMYADCAAAGGNLGLERFARRPVANSHRVGDHGRFRVAVPATAARLARDLHLPAD